MSRSRVATARSLLVLVLCVAAGAVAEGRELGRGRPARFTHPPNYERSTDGLDSLQLTDGQRAPNDWIWLDRRSVGWHLQPGDVVGLTIDLGRSMALDSIVVHSAWYPPSGVLPPALVGAVGSDAAHLVLAGALDASDTPVADSTRAQRVRLVLPVKGTRGRTVVVAALLQGEFLFVDEIEVHGEDGAVSGGVDAAPSDRQRFALTELPAVCAAERRAWAAARALPMGEAAGPHGRGAREAARLAARAAQWRRTSPSWLQVRRVDPWAPLTPWSPLHAERADTLQLWPGAWGAAAIDVASSDSLARRVAVRAEPQAGALGATLREVVAVESRPGGWAGDALPLARESLTVRGGEVRQLWVDVEVPADAVPGTRDIEIRVGAERLWIPVRVHALQLAPPPLGALDWTYPEQFALPRADAAAAVRDNRAHGIDSWCLPAEAVPWPDPAAVSESGHLERTPSFEACDRQVRLHDGDEARRLGWYFDFNPALADPSRGRFRHPYLSRAWKRAFTEWLDLWLARLEAQGIDQRRLFLQPFDETTAAPAEAFYRFLHAARPGVRLALTVTRNATPGELRRLGRHLGLVIFEREALPRHTAWIRAARARGVEVWVYDVLEPPKLADPTLGYRALVWEAWARQLSGVGFWSYGDTGTRSGDAWNDFDGDRSDYAVVYGPEGAPAPLGSEAFAPSKRWQAFRIGMQEAALLEAALEKRPNLRDSILAAVGGPRFDAEAWRSTCIGLLASADDD